MDIKNWYKSRTIWLNIVYLIVALAGLFGFANFNPSPEVMEAVAVLVAAVNIVLRKWFTDTPIV